MPGRLGAELEDRVAVARHRVVVAVTAHDAGEPAPLVGDREMPPSHQLGLDLAEMWDGHSWTIQNPPTPTGAISAWLSSVSCSSPTACTAVGESRYDYPSGSVTMLAERWDGTRTDTQPPRPRGERGVMSFGHHLHGRRRIRNRQPDPGRGVGRQPLDDSTHANSPRPEWIDGLSHRSLLYICDDLRRCRQHRYGPVRRERVMNSLPR